MKQTLKHNYLIKSIYNYLKFNEKLNFRAVNKNIVTNVNQQYLYDIYANVYKKYLEFDEELPFKNLRIQDDITPVIQELLQLSNSIEYNDLLMKILKIHTYLPDLRKEHNYEFENADALLFYKYDYKLRSQMMLNYYSKQQKGNVKILRENEPYQDLLLKYHELYDSLQQQDFQDLLSLEKGQLQTTTNLVFSKILSIRNFINIVKKVYEKELSFYKGTQYYHEMIIKRIGDFNSLKMLINYRFNNLNIIVMMFYYKKYGRLINFSIFDDLDKIKLEHQNLINEIYNNLLKKWLKQNDVQIQEQDYLSMVVEEGEFENSFNDSETDQLQYMLNNCILIMYNQYYNKDNILYMQSKQTSFNNKDTINIFINYLKGIEQAQILRDFMLKLYNIISKNNIYYINKTILDLWEKLREPILQHIKLLLNKGVLFNNLPLFNVDSKECELTRQIKKLTNNEFIKIGRITDIINGVEAKYLSLSKKVEKIFNKI